MISVVIPTLNGGEQFSNVLIGLKKQIVTPDSILVIDSGSSDRTTELAQNYNCQVLQIKKHDFDHGTTRNFAVTQTDSEFVIFLTQDAIPADEQMIAKLIKPMQKNPNIALCYGRQLPKPKVHPLERFWREFNYPPHSALKTEKDIPILGLRAFFCSNCCSAIRRSIFEKLGGFKNNVMVNEDMLFAAEAIKAGYAVYYTAEAKVYHSHDYTLPEKIKRYFNIGRFFADNRWLLQHEHANLKRYGGNVLKSGVKTLRREKKLCYIPAFLTELAIKAITCKLGWYYQLCFHKKRI